MLTRLAGLAFLAVALTSCRQSAQANRPYATGVWLTRIPAMSVFPDSGLGTGWIRRDSSAISLASDGTAGKEIRIDPRWHVVNIVTATAALSWVVTEDPDSLYLVNLDDRRIKQRFSYDFRFHQAFSGNVMWWIANGSLQRATVTGTGAAVAALSLPRGPTIWSVHARPNVQNAILRGDETLADGSIRRTVFALVGWDPAGLTLRDTFTVDGGADWINERRSRDTLLLRTPAGVLALRLGAGGMSRSAPVSIGGRYIAGAGRGGRGWISVEHRGLRLVTVEDTAVRLSEPYVMNENINEIVSGPGKLTVAIGDSGGVYVNVEGGAGPAFRALKTSVGWLVRGQPRAIATRSCIWLVTRSGALMTIDSVGRMLSVPGWEGLEFADLRRSRTVGDTAWIRLPTGVGVAVLSPRPSLARRLLPAQVVEAITPWGDARTWLETDESLYVVHPATDLQSASIEGRALRWRSGGQSAGSARLLVLLPRELPTVRFGWKAGTAPTDSQNFQVTVGKGASVFVCRTNIPTLRDGCQDSGFNGRDRGTVKLQYADELGADLAVVWPRVSVSPDVPTPKLRNTLLVFLGILVGGSFLLLTGARRFLPLIMVALTGSAGALHTNLSIDGWYLLGLAALTLALSVVWALLSDKAFRIIATMWPFDQLAPYLLMLDRIRAPHYRNYVETVASDLDPEREPVKARLRVRDSRAGGAAPLPVPPETPDAAETIAGFFPTIDSDSQIPAAHVVVFGDEGCARAILERAAARLLSAFRDDPERPLPVIVKRGTADIYESVGDWLEEGTYVSEPVLKSELKRGAYVLFLEAFGRDDLRQEETALRKFLGKEGSRTRCVLFVQAAADSEVGQAARSALSRALRRIEVEALASTPAPAPPPTVPASSPVAR